MNIKLPAVVSTTVKRSNKSNNSSNKNCQFMARMRMISVVLSIGAGSMFLVSLDSVVDNLIPVARNYLINLYGSEAEADLAWSWIVSARIYGLAFGCFGVFLISNLQNRKRPLLFAFLLNLLGGALSSLIRLPQIGIQLAFIGRFLSGIGSGVAHIVGAAMLAEIPPIRQRGIALASLTVWACLGELFGMFISLNNVLGTPDQWHIALGFPVLIIPFAMFFLATAPDSPRALLTSGKENKALKSLQFYQNSEDWIVSMKDIRTELSEQYREEHFLLKQNMSADDKNSALIIMKSRFSTGKFVYPLMLGAFILTFTHLDDWLWISYSTQAFENAGVPTVIAQKSSLWMSIPQAMISIALLFCFEEISRRQLLILPTIGSVFCALISIYVVLSSGALISPEHLPVIAALDLCNAAVASASAYSIVPELFPQKDRIMGTALIGMTQNLFGGFLTTIALPLMNQWGIEYVLLPFAVMNVIYIIVVSKLLPETRGKSFHEISKSFPENLPTLCHKSFGISRIYPSLLTNIKRYLVHLAALLYS
uniref:Major facilitator superfamily (MFS) profile domain-containing protein n=1 Tax=Meloidogyne incognita TaxID=6306 RepID=A0A914KIV2_MELIC